MITKFGETDELKIKKLEKKAKITLPLDYKTFLMQNNGGTAEDMPVFKVEGTEETVALDSLFGIGLEDDLDILGWYDEYKDDLLEHMLIIGNGVEVGLILLINQDDWKGIYLWDYALDFEESTEEECIYKIADNFDKFISLLVVEE